MGDVGNLPHRLTILPITHHPSPLAVPPMRNLAAALQSIAATLWVGGMWVTGYVVAPVLFATLSDRTLAGLVAGRLFSLIAWVGMACAADLLIVRLARS